MAVEIEKGQVWERRDGSGCLRITAVGEELALCKRTIKSECKLAEIWIDIGRLRDVCRLIGHWDAARGVVVRDDVQHG